MTTVTPPRAIERREVAVDAALAVALCVLTVASAYTPDPDVTYTFAPPNGWTAGLAVAASLPLALRRRYPLAVAMVCGAAATATAAAGWSAGDTPVCVMFALYAVAAWASRPRAVAALAFGLLGMGLLAVLRVPYFESPLALVSAAAMTIAWTIGRVMRRWRGDRAAAEARAVAAEGARVVAAERAVLVERLRIARELHDVITHALSVIAVQSGVARFRAEDPAGGSSGALLAIEEASRSALDDLRRMLGVLRTAPPDQPAPAATPRPPRAGVRESIVDISVAAALGVFAISQAYVKDPSVATIYSPPTAWLIVLVLVATLPLAGRRRWPVAVLLTSWAAATAVGIGGWSTDVAAFAGCVALYTVAAWRPLWMAAAGLALVAAPSGLTLIRTGTLDAPITEVTLPIAVPFVLGVVVRRWRQGHDVAQERALEAERTRAVAAERAVFAERLSIARELHDVVSHALSVIAVQAGVARYQQSTSPDAVPVHGALVAVEEASRTALADLRRMLAVLQADADPASLEPSPGLSDLDGLVTAHRRLAGTVTVEIDEALHRARPSLQLTAYRLVQEALTNARKHAPGASVRIRLTAMDDGLLVQVDDDGTVSAVGPAGGSGLGIVGMRERAALFDGTVTAEPGASGGFRVEAHLRQVREVAA